MLIFLVIDIFPWKDTACSLSPPEVCPSVGKVGSAQTQSPVGKLTSFHWICHLIQAWAVKWHWRRLFIDVFLYCFNQNKPVNTVEKLNMSFHSLFIQCYISKKNIILSLFSENKRPTDGGRRWLRSSSTDIYYFIYSGNTAILLTLALLV